MEGGWGGGGGTGSFKLKLISKLHFEIRKQVWVKLLE